MESLAIRLSLVGVDEPFAMLYPHHKILDNRMCMLNSRQAFNRSFELLTNLAQTLELSSDLIKRVTHILRTLITKSLGEISSENYDMKVNWGKTHLLLQC